MNDTTDAVVIGAGAIGAAVAFELSKLRYRVVCVDRLPQVGAGSTSSSSANVRFHYEVPEDVILAWEAHFGWESWSEYVGAAPKGPFARLYKTGALVLDGSTDREQVLSHFATVGVPYETWEPDDIRSRIPGLDPARYGPPQRVTGDVFWTERQGDLGGFFTPDAGFVDDPQVAAANLIGAAKRFGAGVRLGDEVVAILRSSGDVKGVRLRSGEVINAPIVVNAAGPHSARINELAGVSDEFSVGTRPLRVEVHMLPAPASYAGGGLGPVVADGDLGIYFRSHVNGQLLVGGREPDCDPLEWVVDADRFSVTPTEVAWTTQTSRLGLRIPELRIPLRPRGLAALYDVSDDWRPIYDRTSLDGYFVAIGSSGNQFKNLPVLGRLIAALIDQSQAGADHDHAPVVLRGWHTGLDINLGQYSRLRARRQS